jgi:hypothetical protein
MHEHDKLAAKLWAAIFNLDNDDMVPRGSGPALVGAAKEAIMSYRRLNRELAEARAEVVALTREPSETAEALERLREHVVKAIVAIRRCMVAADPSKTTAQLDAPGALEARCAGMSAEGLGQYLDVYAPSPVLVAGYEDFRRQLKDRDREIAELRAKLAERPTKLVIETCAPEHAVQVGEG